MTRAQQELRAGVPVVTRAQQELIDAVRLFIAENGCSPTVRDLCAMTGRSSTSTIHAHLMRMQKAGLVAWKPGRQRTLRVTQ